MVLNTGNILLVGSILLFMSILAGKTGYKFGVPMLLLFLGVGGETLVERVHRLEGGETA